MKNLAEAAGTLVLDFGAGAIVIYLATAVSASDPWLATGLLLSALVLLPIQGTIVGKIRRRRQRKEAV